MELLNKVAIITGASGGIGSAVARSFDEAGMKLVLSARSEEKLQRVARDLKNAVTVPGEITDPQLPQKLIDAALENFDRVDVVYNNAGVMRIGTIEDADIEGLCEMARINFESVLRLAYLALRQMKRQGSGYLINVSSIAGVKTAPTLGAYNGSKFAVEALTDALRMEVAGTDIGVACIEPGTVDTGLFDAWTADQKKLIEGKGLRPEDIARAIRFILEQPPHLRIPRMLVVPHDSQI